jgi:hypothetical protein
MAMLTIRLEADELQRIHQAAASDGARSTNRWARAVLLDACGRVAYQAELDRIQSAAYTCKVSPRITLHP